MKIATRITCLLLGALGLFCVALSIHFGMDEARFDRTALPAEGTISRIQIIPNYGDDPDTRKVYITYEAGGQAYEVLSRYSNNSMREGQAINIQYDPANPSDMRIDGVVFLPVLFGVMGGIFLLALLVLTQIAGQGQRRMDGLRARGHELYADICEVSPDPSQANGEKIPYVVTVQCSSADGGTTYQFQSEALWFDPRPIIAEYRIKQLPVYVDLDRAIDYSIDLSAITKHADA